MSDTPRIESPTPTDDELFAAYWKDQVRVDFYSHSPARIAEGLRNVYFLGLAAAQMTGSDRYAVEQSCRGCGKPLLIENAWMEDGCPCNTPAGVNNHNFYRWKLLHDLQQSNSRALAAMTKRADDDELAYISLKKHVIDCGLEEIEPGLFRNKRAEEAKWRTVYKACPKHQSLPWNFMLVTTALPAVEVCPHCEQEARGKNG